MSETQRLKIKAKAATAGMLFLEAARDAINAGDGIVAKAFIKLSRANTASFKEAVR